MNRKSGIILAFAVVFVLIAPSYLTVDIEADPVSDWHPAYDTLTEKEKRVYRNMEASISNIMKSADMSGMTIDQGHKLMQALESDHPEYFWFDCYTLYVYKDEGMCSRIELAEKVDKDLISEQRKEIDRVVSDITVTGDSVADKMKCINDWLCINETYDNTTANAGNLVGAFIEKRVKCDGFSFANNYLCKLNGIDSICLTGMANERHAWNAVKADDGKWYQTDVTWNNPKCPGVATYDYFLIGSETVTKSGKFSENRTIEYDFGLELQEQKFDYVIPHSDYGSDWITISYDRVSELSHISNKRYYTINGLQMQFDGAVMSGIKDAMDRMNAEMWYVVVTNSKTTQVVEGLSPMDYSIKLYFDEYQVLPSELGPNKLLIVAPEYTERFYHANYFTMDGALIAEKEMPLTDVTEFTTSYIKDDIPYVWVFVIALLFFTWVAYKIYVRRQSKKAALAYYNAISRGTHCRQCGMPLDQGFQFCPHCGCSNTDSDRDSKY